MLYLEPRTSRLSRFKRALLRLAAPLHNARRHRMAELDLLSMNASLKQDLGLCDADFAELIRSK